MIKFRVNFLQTRFVYRTSNSETSLNERRLLSSSSQKRRNNQENAVTDYSGSTSTFELKPIGFIRSCFPEKNGTPRQASLCRYTRAKLTIQPPQIGNTPSHHYVDRLEDYSHVHLLFWFHQNVLGDATIKPKVKPPRLEGRKVGVMATRSPHRPNPIGLSVARIERIENSTIYLSGIDLVDGTPILDIKPYLPEYDSVASARVPEWIKSPPVETLNVEFSEKSLHQLQNCVDNGILEFYDKLDDIKNAIEEVLRLDPRSTFFRRKLEDQQYGFCLDCLNIICVFDKDNNIMKIVEVEDWSMKYGRGKQGKDYNNPQRK